MNTLLNIQPEAFPADFEFDEMEGSYLAEAPEAGLGDQEWAGEVPRRRIPVRRPTLTQRPRPVRPVRPGRPPLRPPRRPRPRPWPSVAVYPPWPGGEPPTDTEPGAGGAAGGTEFVRWVQDSLNRILGQQLPVDGVMTPETRQAIRDFQTRMGLLTDGIVGPETRQALAAERQKLATAAPPDGSDTELLGRLDWSASGEFDLETGEPMNEYELTDAELTAESRRAPRRPRPRPPSETDILRSAIHNGTTNENQLADLIFFRRHPERNGRLISASEPGFAQLSQEWLRIRDTLVRPLLRGAPKTPSTPSVPPPPSVSPPPPPPSGPPAAGEPQVTINSGVLVSDNAVRVLKEILLMAGLTRATITSGRRTSTDQARIMYDLIERHGVPYAKNLYGSYGDQVIDVYSAQKAAGQSATAIKQAMEARINQLGCPNVSHHCSDTHDVIDVAPSSIADQNAFRQALDAALRSGLIDKYIPPPQDPAFHIEIVLSPTANELMARILRSPPLPLDAFLPRGARLEMD